MSDSQTIVHHHEHKIELKGLSKYLLPPLLLGGSMFFIVKTEGEFKEINYLAPIFAGLCVWTVIF
jgi:hypothetical protein